MPIGQRYPFATADGIAIPSDIIKPLGVVVIAVQSVIASTPIVIPANVEVISFIATEDCLVVFGAAASKPGDRVLLENALYVPAKTIVQASPPLANLSVIGLTAAGTMVVQFIESWAGLVKSTQLSRA